MCRFKFFAFPLNVLLMLLTVFLWTPPLSSEGCIPTTTFVINRAYQLIKVKKIEKAVSLMEKYKKEHPGLCPQFFLYFGNFCVMAHHYKKAITLLKIFLKKEPHSLEGWNLLGSAFYGNKDYKRGGEAFLKAYSLSCKKDGKYLYFAGICCYFQGKKKMACRLIKRAIENSRETHPYEWLRTLISILFSLKKYREALPYVVELSSAPIRDKKQWQDIRIQIYLLLHKWKDARSYLYSLLDKDPLNTQWWNYLFRIYLGENKPREALAALLIKGFIRPLSSKEKKTVGDLYLQMDIPLEAVRFYESIARKKHNFKELAPILARCYLRLQRPKKALFWINRARKKKKDPTLLFLKGVILYQLKRFDSAALSFESSARISPSPSECYLLAGYSAFYAKKWREAKRFFILASKDKKRRKNALRMLQYLKNLKKGNL